MSSELPSPAALLDVFCAHVPPDASALAPALGARLGERLRDLVAVAAEAWPTLYVPPLDFVAFVAERAGQAVTTADELETALAHLHVADLYLVHACVRGDHAAHVAMEEECFGRVKNALRRCRLTADRCTDVVQLLREHILTAPASGTPRLARYAGRGALHRWLSAAALQIALRPQPGRAAEREIPLELTASMQALTPESTYLQDAYREPFANACNEAIAALSAGERTLLKLRFADALTVEEIGRLYSVHHATISRRLARLERHLGKQIRRLLRRDLKVDDSTLESIVRLAKSQISISLTLDAPDAGSTHAAEKP